MRASHLFMFALLACAPAQAVTIEQKLPDASQEQVAQNAIGKLNCVVCEGQALADSDATFAREMRHEIRRMASEGATTDDILTYFRARYGASILLTPPVQSNTLILWFAPLAMVLLGAWILWRTTRPGGGSQ